MKVNYSSTDMRQWFFRIVYPSFSLNVVDGIMIVLKLIIFFKKTLAKSPNKKCSQLSDKENDTN